ncbi:MAG: AraC family transcriptional regulator, partial [Castellaniella sp.]
HLSVPSLVFGLRSGAGGPAMGFDIQVCAVDPPPLRTTGGFSIIPEHDLTALERADWVIVPTWHDDCRPAPDVLIRALRLAGERGAGLVGLCLGAFPLAQAGLLDGLRATTHWAYADRLARRHPRIRVEREALYVDEGKVLTSAGVAAGLDCCLHLLGRLGGAGAASHAARR